MAEICVTVARTRFGKVLEEVREAADAKAGMAEVRLDFCKREPNFKELLQARGCPLVATIRRRQEGGRWDKDEDLRLRWLRLAVAEGVDYVDLEMDIAGKIPRYGATKRIVSHHDTKGMPPNLAELHAEMCKLDPDIVKLACRAEHAADLFEMLRLVKNATVPTIAIAMGELGTPSRILGAKFGSPFTYAAFNPERVVAPGMLTFEEMRQLYRYEKIGPDTRVFGVIGDPIHQSFSPAVHNACYEKLGLDCVYVPFLVPARHLREFFNQMPAADLRGLSVTIPHKPAVMSYGTPADTLTSDCDAANTIVVRDGRKYLYNTDGPAAAAALSQAAVAPIPGAALPNQSELPLEGRTALLVGAGGVARSIAVALRRAGLLVSVAARKNDKAQELATAAGVTFLRWAERYSRYFDVVVNCTPVGMVPNTEETPYHAGSLKEGMTVLDTVYNPENTLFVREALARQCRVASGVEMFVRQAEAQFQLFTGQAAPPGLMSAVVREELSPAKKMLRDARLGLVKEKAEP